MRFFIFMLTGFFVTTVIAGKPVSSDDAWEPVNGANRKAMAQNSNYSNAIQGAAQMTSNARTAALVRKHGLNIMNITWEDTGRYKNSSAGPNISDMSIQVAEKGPKGDYKLTLMPVIRYDNFTDKTVDIDPRQFTLLVGNEKGAGLKRLSLREFLENPTQYLHNAGSWRNAKKSLLAERDTKVLVSAQASFLPVPKTGLAEFNPVIFNYQSVSGDPAVLTILVTRQGASTTIIDNKRDGLGSGWGQRLFHNKNGNRASLTGQRISDFVKTDAGKQSTGIQDPAKLDVKKSSGLNMVLLIQVPLKQKNPPRQQSWDDGIMFEQSASPTAAPLRTKSDVEAAVIGHGKVEGPFTEIDNLSIERDHRFPVRVTVQFYKATATGAADAADIAQIKHEIESVYKSGDAAGSLVVGGETGRITEYHGIKVQPAGWWKEFWKRHEQNTGETKSQAMQRLTELLGKDYLRQPVCELYLAEKLRKRAL